MLLNRGAGILLVHNNNILILKRSDVCTYAGTWCLPAGRIDREDYDIDSTLSRALKKGALRELYEETNLKISYFENNYLGFIDTNDDNKKFFFRTYIHTIDDEAVNIINSEIELDYEHTDWMWRDYKMILNQDNKELHPGLMRALLKLDSFLKLN